MTLGGLVLVGTPIGNLGDLSPAAVTALGDADVIACEDTRRTRTLLSHAGIAVPALVVVNEHTEAAAIPKLMARLSQGAGVALVSDAGMPGISDPGERLVVAAIAGGIPVRVVPGPSAALAALVVSGLPTARFCFEGFLPRKGSGRKERLGAVSVEPRTSVLFEAPHRVRQTVADLTAACGDERRVAVGRELTKKFEEVWRGTLGEAGLWLAERDPRGEYVLVLDGAPPGEQASESEIESALAVELAAGATKRDAVDAVSAALGVPRRRVYNLAIRGASRP